MTSRHVLVLSAYPPGVFQYSIETALRQLGHRVFTAGATRDVLGDVEQALKRWDPDYRYDLLGEPDMPLTDVLGACPFSPDLILHLETAIPFLPEGIEDAPCPTAALFSEDQLHADWYGQLFPYFDLALCTWKATERTWQAHGHDNVRQWYFGARPEFCWDLELPRVYDVAFLGNLNPHIQRRRLPAVQKILKLRGEGVKVHVSGGVYFEDYNRVHCQSKIVYHRGITDQVNMRVFEAMAAGCLVVMQRPADPDDPTTYFFRDREHVVYCDSDDEAIALIRHYLVHDDERRRIAEAGRAKVMREHNYTDVARQLFADVLPEIPADYRARRRDRLARWGKDDRRRRLDYARYYLSFGGVAAGYRQISRIPDLAADPEALNFLAVTLALDGQTDNAVRCLEAASRHPQAVLASVNLAAIALTTGRADAERRSEDALARLDAVGPDGAPPGLVEGPIFPSEYERFRIEVAHASFRKPAGAGRTAALARLYRFRLYQLAARRALAEERIEAAAGYIDQALAIMPDDGYLLYDRAHVDVYRGDTATAIADLRRAVALEPFFVRAQRDLAACFEAAGQVDDALVLVRDLVHHTPMTPSDDLTQWMERLAARADDGGRRPRASVVLVADEPRLVQRAVVSLHQHTWPDDLAEVIVVKRAGGPAMDAFLGLVDAPLVVVEAGDSPTADYVRAAQRATGTHLVFLDQRLAVQGDWLPSLLAAADERTLALPMIDDPSGTAALGTGFCIRADLWRALDGLDPRLPPDRAVGDLVARLRARGGGVEVTESAAVLLPTPPPCRPRASIVVLAWNQLEYTRECVASVLACTPPPFELILVDNGSTDGTLEYFKTVPGAKIVANATNLGFAGGNNHGIQAATGDYVVILNNDTLVTEGWLERLIACAEEDATIGIVGPMSNYVSGPQLVPDAAYDSFAGLQAYARAFHQRHEGQRLTLDRLVGFCILVKRAVIEKVGVFDERFGLGNFEDDDYCARARRAGFRLMVAGDVFIHHFGSRTFIGNGVDFVAAMQHGQREFEAKWGGGGQAHPANGHGAANGHGRAGGVEALVAQARARLEAGAADDAVRGFQQALALVPNHPEAQAGLVAASHLAHPPLDPNDVGRIADTFHRAWYDANAWAKLHWFGLPIRKNPFDVLQYQEVITEQRPNVIVECGAFVGGSTLYFAHLLDLLGHGRVVSIELAGSWDPLVTRHPRVTAITGSSVAPETIARVRSLVPAGGRVFVILDSDHRAEHVLAELRAYAPFVHVGGYLIAEDSNINGHPVLPGWGAGPWEAAQTFLRENPNFAPDREREAKLLMTFAPSGWLRRIR